MSRVSELLKAYNFQANKPMISSPLLNVYEGTNKQTGTKVAIKVFKRADNQLASYLNKMKLAASENVVRFYEILNEPESHQLVIIQQAVPYGTLAQALNKCKRLEDDDALSIIKQLLNAHIDLLRVGVVWNGTEQDIEVTENGVRLSWNNSVVYSENNPNPFPELFTNIAVRKSQSSILPFPPNKMINDLIKVSTENASEISLHPLLKKREKVFKKKGKGWFAIKEYKVRGQYGQELTYTAVSRERGLLRVKVFEKGQIDENLIKVYQTNPSFTKLIDYYEENGNFITVSEYANDGSVQSYVKRLKTSNTALKENQIEFIFFSLIEPLKTINASPVVSFNFLNIRSVYIENGIPKIGQISPMNEVLDETLKERADVPDFFHKEFKANPQTKDPRYDTYSLGVLLYKLMYTEYPIFPQDRVHIPTTPTYKKTLKDALILFFNTGGDLTELEAQLEVDEEIRNQVKINEKMLQGVKKTGMRESFIGQAAAQQYHSELSIGRQEEEATLEQKEKTCCGRLWIFLNTRGTDPEGKYMRMQKSPFSFYRKCTVATLTLTLYFLAFFLFYVQGFYNLISHTRLFFPANVNVLGQTHRVIISSYHDFNIAVNHHGAFTSTEQVTTNLGCIIDDQGIYYDFLRPASPHWYIFLLLSFAAMVTIMLLKGWQSAQFSFVRMLSHYYDTTIDGANQSRFAMSSYIFFQLWFHMALYGFFYLFNFIYLEQHTPCVGGHQISKLSDTLFTDRIKFALNYLIPLCVLFLFGVMSFIQISKLYAKIPYNSLLNPIFIYTPFYIAAWVMFRIGAFSSFDPSFVKNTEGVIGSSWMNFIGYFPQILFLIELPVEILVDLIYYKCLENRVQALSMVSSFHNENEAGMIEVDQNDKEV